MEEKVLKVNITISDEGIVYIDGITADMEALDETIENNSVLMNCCSKNGYDVMYENYKAYLNDSGAKVAEIHKKLDFVNYLYQNQCKIVGVCCPPWRLDSVIFLKYDINKKENLHGRKSS